MKDGRKTTYEEPVEIVEYCIAQDKNYGVAIDLKRTRKQDELISSIHEYIA